MAAILFLIIQTTVAGTMPDCLFKFPDTFFSFLSLRFLGKDPMNLNASSMLVAK